MAVPETPTPPLIPQYFAGREVFITGATGFIGKVLVERLLWTCRDISQLHLLMRSKKDVAPEKRLAELKQSQVFDVIREHCPQQLDKLRVVPGDVTKHAFDLGVQGLSQLQQVSVVFHSAATVKLDEPLAVAVDQNVRSVITLTDICDQLPQMQVLIHVSTAYSNAEFTNIEERVYPAPAKLNHLLALVDTVPQDILGEITSKIISPKPYTYTFTKAMAECVVAERTATSQYATAIFRPTIVVSALRHPFPGWIESLNGPSSVIVAAGKGLMHVISCSGDKRADIIPVDICVDTLIAVAWETGMDNAREARVYNCSSYEHPTTWKEFRDHFMREVRSDPFDNVLWYPFFFLTDNRVIQKTLAALLHTIPLYTIHYVSKICGYEPSSNVLNVSKRLQAIEDALRFPTTREWHFSTENVQRLRQRLSSSDAAVYNLDPRTIDWARHAADYVKGVRKYILREKDQDIAKAKTRMFKLHMMHTAIMLVFVLLLYRLGTRKPPPCKL